MTVYVDNMKMKAQFFRWNGVWSNLWADTTEELVDFADEVLGLSRSSMVDEGYIAERFVINEKRRARALEAGVEAIQWGGPAMLKILRAKKARGYKEKGL